MSKSKVFIPFNKVDQEQRMVYGYASTETQDNQGEVTKLDTIAAALDDYMKFANIREMHKANAVGVCKSAEITDEGLYIGAKIVDDAAWDKVKERVYKGFSIGGKAKRDGNVLTELRLTEISLVDRPANPDCIIDIWKMDGGEELNKTVKKGLYSVKTLVNLLQDLYYLQQDTAWEAEYEGDQSELPAKLKGVAVEMASILKDMVGEETDELIATMTKADIPVDVFKAGARNSKTDLEKIQTMHDHACDLGANCKGKEVDKSMKIEDVAKVDGLTDVAKAELVSVINNELEPVLKAISVLEDVKKTIEAFSGIEERLSKVEGQPLPPKVAGKQISVSKADDINQQQPQNDDVAKADAVLEQIQKANPDFVAY